MPRQEHQQPLCRGDAFIVPEPSIGVEFRQLNGPSASFIGDVRPDATATCDHEQPQIPFAGLVRSHASIVVD